jgi:hypothetical protein
MAYVEAMLVTLALQKRDRFLYKKRYLSNFGLPTFKLVTAQVVMHAIDAPELLKSYVRKASAPHGLSDAKIMHDAA